MEVRIVFRLTALFGTILALATLSVATLGIARAAAPRSSAGPIDAKIEIVWPHDQQGNPAPVASAPLVNVEVYLFQRGTLDPVPCNFANPVTLRWAQNGTSHVGWPTVTGPRGDGELAPAYDEYLQRTDG